MIKVTGIGGIFLKCKNKEKMEEWYKTHLGIDHGNYGKTFNWVELSQLTPTSSLTWSLTKDNTDKENTNNCVINYTVNNLEKLVDELKISNVTILDKIETYSYGKFVHILDIENNTIELWEPL